MTEKRMTSRITHNARKLLRFLDAHSASINPLLILAHDYPDPDALAGALALQYLCERGYGMSAKVVYGGIIGRRENQAMVQLLKLSVHKLKQADLKKYAHVALIDTQPKFRNNSFPHNRRATIVIDQHPSEEKPLTDLAIVDPECGATCVILARALLLKGVSIPATIATSIAYGILSDTLNLYRTTRPDVIQTYMEMLRYSDLRALAHIQNPSRSRKFFYTLAQGIQNAQVRKGLLVCHLDAVESPDLVAQVADFMLTYHRMSWVLSTGRFKGRLYVSLRASRPNVQAGEILRDIFEHRGEAGGHDVIGGGSFKVGVDVDETIWQEAEKTLSQRLVRRLRIPTKSDFYYPFRRA